MELTHRSLQAPGFYRFAVGALAVTVINDGWFALDTGAFSGDAASAAQLLDAAYLPTGIIKTSTNAWLVETGAKRILIDAGSSPALLPDAGRVIHNLSAAGIDAETIDGVILTHMHGDHVDGLLTRDGQPAFPNATVHVSEAEYDFWMSDTVYATLPERFKAFADVARTAIAPYARRLMTFRDGEELAPGVVAAMAPGHTAGHTMLRLSSQGRQLLIWGDLVHNDALQCPEPDRSLPYDTDPVMAAATRSKVLEMAATERLLVAGSHLSFPGLGHVGRASHGYGYVQASWNADPC